MVIILGVPVLEFCGYLVSYMVGSRGPVVQN